MFRIKVLVAMLIGVLVLAAGSFAVADLARHLDGPSRLVLVRRLVREGLLESTAVA